MTTIDEADEKQYRQPPLRPGQAGADIRSLQAPTGSVTIAWSPADGSWYLFGLTDIQNGTPVELDVTSQIDSIIYEAKAKWELEQ